MTVRFWTVLMVFISSMCLAQQVTQNVDALEFKRLVENHQNVLIDLRTDEEISRHGMIEGAQQINYLEKDAEKKLEALDRSKTYLLYCAGGGRSSDCAYLMEQLGFKIIYNLEKGFDEWKKKGYGVQKK